MIDPFDDCETVAPTLEKLIKGDGVVDEKEYQDLHTHLLQCPSCLRKFLREVPEDVWKMRAFSSQQLS